jgi:hypothetical protein
MRWQGGELQIDGKALLLVNVFVLVASSSTIKRPNSYTKEV